MSDTNATKVAASSANCGDGCCTSTVTKDAKASCGCQDCTNCEGCNDCKDCKGCQDCKVVSTARLERVCVDAKGAPTAKVVMTAKTARVL